MAGWLDKPEQWQRLTEVLLAKGEAGVDSETYNQPYKTSPQHRTKIHCWSLAVLTEHLTPRGYHRASGVALPRAALEYAPLVRALQSIRLWAHNAPHDQHSFANEGVELDIGDTLQWARVACPGKRDYGLKTKGVKVGMETWALGKPGRDGFMDLVTYQVEETTERTKLDKVCVCGDRPCRARQISEWWDPELGWFRKHERVQLPIVTKVTKTATKRYEVPEFTPEHPRWKPWLDYVIVDSVSGIELKDWLANRPVVERAYPWRTK